ncbi:unnamed protein product [marine sediment metagenome]|uniref:Uncharacterized protein n=1 Tax=marine sediment metagenome TaxID=412755 RepID=X1TZL5_9ZZZZ
MKTPKYVFLFPNKMIAATGSTGEQINELQGQVSIEKLIEVLQHCDKSTVFKFNCNWTTL